MMRRGGAVFGVSEAVQLTMGPDEAGASSGPIRQRTSGAARYW